jgi:hypothetical protein
LRHQIWRWRPVLVAALFFLIIGSAAAHEGDLVPHDEPEVPVLLGLSGQQLWMAAAVGGFLGGTLAITVRGATAGTGIGLLATIYIVHLVVEAGVVGGAYYLWPEGGTHEDPPIPADESGRRIAGLGFATGAPRAGH